MGTLAQFRHGLAQTNKQTKIVMKRLFLSLAVSILLTPSLAQPLSLDECMAYAVKNSISVKKQEVAVDNNRTAVNSSIMNLLPSVSGSTSGSFSFGRSIDPETNSYQSRTTFSNSYSLSASMTLFSGFSAINSIRAAKVARAIGVGELQIAKDNAALNTMSAYFDVVYYAGAINIAEEQLAASQQDLRNVEKLLELGLKSPAEVAEVTAQVASYDYMLITQQNNYDMAMIKLRNEMNYPADSPLEIDTSLPIQIMAPSATFEQVTAYAMEYNPKVMNATLSVRESKLNLSRTKAAFYPHISASGGYNTSFYTDMDNGAAYAAWWNQLRDNRGSYVGVSMSIPIFSRLSNRFEKRRAKNSLRTSILNEESTRQEVQREIAQTFQQMQGSGKQYVQSSRRVEAARLAHEGMAQKFAKGLVSPMELHTSANELMEAQAEQLRSRLDYIIQCRMVDYYNGEPLIKKQN